MKHYIIILVAAIAILTVSSCHPSSGTTPPPVTTPTVTPTVPVSTFNITYNGKTYNLTTANSVLINALTASSTSPVQWGVTAMAQNSHISCNFMAEKVDMSSAIGTYNKIGCGGGYTYSIPTLTDFDDGNKKYESDCTGHDTTGSINVTMSNATECKGTFSLTLTYNGHYYPATGDFDYKH